MEDRIIEACVNCDKKTISFKKIKDPHKCDIYLNVCYKCPYQTEFMILSGNEQTSLPIELKNIYSIIELIKKNKFYHIEKTNAKINVFMETCGRRFSTSKKYDLIFKFIEYLGFSDKIRPIIKKLKMEATENFLKDLVDKRKGL